MTRRRLCAALLAVTLTASACGALPEGRWSDDESPTPTSGPSTSAPGPVTGSIRWSDCQAEAEKLAGSPLSGVKVDCGTLAVPVDWSKPSGQKLDLALMRVRNNSTGDRIGSLLLNPGGPGGSGIELAAYSPLLLPVAVRRQFDVIGFDPRGVGKSTPVSCISDADKDAASAMDYDPVSQAAFDAAVASARKVGNDCGAKYGATLGFFSTEQTARDMDAIRAAVGDEKLTYLGYSYGTLLGAVYAKLFPDKVRALVLDGAVDPQQDTVASSEGQAAGFEKAFDAFADYCRTTTSCPIGPDARATVTQLLERTRTTPIRGSGGRNATSGHVFLAVLSALYVQQQWPTLASAIADARDGDPSAVFELGDQYNRRDSYGHYSNQIDANYAINCADEDTKVSLDQVRRLQAQWRAKYPLFGGALAMSLIGCTEWPAPADPYPTGAAVGAPPIVVIGTEGDPATPYENAGKLATQLGVGVLLTWKGEGHTAYPQTACLRDTVNDYLLSLRVPQDGMTCPAR